MAEKQPIRFEGLREFRRALKNTSDGMDDLKAVHKAGAEIVARRSAQIVPTGATGMLRDSIDSRGTATKAYVRAGGTRGGVPYAGPIHFGSPKGWPADGFGGYGTGTLRPQPFIYDAMDDRIGEVLDLYNDRLATLARRHGLDVKKVQAV
jgi:hypothetical protein